MSRIPKIALLGACAVALVGCTTSDVEWQANGTPQFEHSTQNWWRYQFVYHPEAQLYFEPYSSTYYWFANGHWQHSETCPKWAQPNPAHARVVKLYANSPHFQHATVAHTHGPWNPHAVIHPASFDPQMQFEMANLRRDYDVTTTPMYTTSTNPSTSSPTHHADTSFDQFDDTSTSGLQMHETETWSGAESWESEPWNEWTETESTGTFDNSIDNTTSFDNSIDNTTSFDQSNADWSHVDMQFIDEVPIPSDQQIESVDATSDFSTDPRWADVDMNFMDEVELEAVPTGPSTESSTNSITTFDENDPRWAEVDMRFLDQVDEKDNPWVEEMLGESLTETVNEVTEVTSTETNTESDTEIVEANESSENESETESEEVANVDPNADPD